MIHSHRYDLDVAGNDDIVNGTAAQLLITCRIPCAIISIGNVIVLQHRIVFAHISIRVEIAGQHLVLSRVFIHDLQHLCQLLLTSIFVLMRQVRVVERDFFAARCRINSSRISSGLADAFADQRAAALIAKCGCREDADPVFSSSIVDCFLEMVVCEVARVHEFFHHVDRIT